MKDNRIVGTCATCGMRFDVLMGFDCPNCRRGAVEATFAPVNPLRTALGVTGQKFPKNAQQWEQAKEELLMRGIVWHGPEPGLNPCAEIDLGEPTPKGCKMPVGDASQIYELRRMFRL